MADSELKSRLQNDVKSAMKAGEKDRLATLRLIMAAIKQVEVDERKALSDADVIALLDKMTKQRRESIEQYSKAKREDLIAVEEAELVIIKEYLPAQLSEAEIAELIKQAVQESGAESIRDMGKVMAIIKPQAQGRADMAKISAAVKAQLA